MTTSEPGRRPDVSILIVNYNVKDYLLQCLRSIQDRDDALEVQVVVVDNASSDNSVDELRPQFPDVQWIALEENLGFGRGNNVGLEACTGRYVLFLNPDTIISQDTLSTMVRYLDAHPEVGLAGCKVLNPGWDVPAGLSTRSANAMGIVLQALWPAVAVSQVTTLCSV